jgi:hypothetical protein
VAPAPSRIARYEVILAWVGLALGAVGMAYLAINALVNHEACYGVTASHIECLPVDQAAAARVVVVLTYLVPLYIGAALAMRWQTRAIEPTARNTAFGATATCVASLLALVVSAVGGAGFFLLPSAVVMAVAAVLGVILWWRGSRSAYTREAITAIFAREKTAPDANDELIDE